MRRAERLFEIVQLIRSRRLSTAAWLAERLEVSERTIYRDISDLQAQGVPIEGEAGMGYRMRAGFDLPPMMFTSQEAQSLAAAVRLAQGWLDPVLARHAEVALGKIMAVLPTAARVAAESVALYAPPVGDPAARDRLARVREAIESRHKLRIDYEDVQGRVTQRVIRPLGCFYWGKIWTLGAWCEHRGDFRNFRIDRIRAVETLDQRFQDEPGRTLADLFRRTEAEAREYERSLRS
ncbi:helix-turn-helix transcriptional regulator [Caldimonas thermodepolymerans]|uniref:helix-turn-helix transcriptional regulator n=1 Tax=Caldimonas thermodepolymerans TaxID=215580 RepID=UPI002492190D|nr:YafY family protein [Caldimonas thermodepolymerans]